MKNSKNIILTMLILIVTVSCSTVEKITVYGNPGEKIYSPYKQQIATIQQNGKVNINLDSDAYYGYLYTYQPTYDQWVPFALDITKKSHNGTKIAAGAGYTLTSLGLAGMIGGGIGCIIDDESDAAKAIMLGGLGIGGIGASFGVPASSRMGQLAYQYNFGYTSRQQTNSDLRLSAYTVPETKVIENLETRKKATSGESTEITDASSAKARKNTATSTAKKKRKSSAELISGEYLGNGTLVTTGEDPEPLGSIMIIITPKDSDRVLVEIMEDNEAFFESEELYTVKKNKDGSFTLTHTRIPAVKFIITKAGKIDYKHPKVNIEGTNYTLSISGKKNIK